MTKTKELQQRRLTYRTSEVCSMLGISARTLTRLERRGLIRSSKLLRTKLYPLAEVEKMLREAMP